MNAPIKMDAHILRNASKTILSGMALTLGFFILASTAVFTPCAYAAPSCNIAQNDPLPENDADTEPGKQNGGGKTGAPSQETSDNALAASHPKGGAAVPFPQSLQASSCDIARNDPLTRPEVSEEPSQDLATAPNTPESNSNDPLARPEASEEPGPALAVAPDAPESNSATNQESAGAQQNAPMQSQPVSDWNAISECDSCKNPLSENELLALNDTSSESSAFDSAGTQATESLDGYSRSANPNPQGPLAGMENAGAEELSYGYSDSPPSDALSTSPGASPSDVGREAGYLPEGGSGDLFTGGASPSDNPEGAYPPAGIGTTPGGVNPGGDLLDLITGKDPSTGSGESQSGIGGGASGGGGWGNAPGGSTQDRPAPGAIPPNGDSGDFPDIPSVVPPRFPGLDTGSIGDVVANIPDMVISGNGGWVFDDPIRPGVGSNDEVSDSSGGKGEFISSDEQADNNMLGAD